jgi:hypothetical protein
MLWILPHLCSLPAAQKSSSVARLNMRSGLLFSTLQLLLLLLLQLLLLLLLVVVFSLGTSNASASAS